MKSEQTLYESLRHTCEQYRKSSLPNWRMDPDCQKCVMRQARIERAKERAEGVTYLGSGRRRPSLSELDRDKG